jgi:ATP-binding cassette subfamily F protein 3
MEEARQPLFHKKPTAGNSNTEMSKWRKKEKGGADKDKEKAMLKLQKHMEEIEQRKKELPPVQIRRERLGTGKNNDLILENITLTIAGKSLLEGTNVKIAYGRKYGLVGRNGIGKTCLMNALARGEFPKMPQHLQILLVEQEIRDTSKSVINTVLETDIERDRLMN